MNTQRYPLAWPTGWKRTRAYDRRRADFSTQKKTPMTQNGQVSVRVERRSLTVSDALRRLLGELHRLGVSDGDAIISTNVPVRLDGLPYSGSREPDDPGVAVYFRLKRQDRVLACDTWNRVADNLAAVAQHIDALRRIDRYGVGTLEQAFAGYAALPAKGSTWRTTLGFAGDEALDAERIERAFRERAKAAHPDVIGGSHDAMASLNEARREGLAEVRA